MGPRGGALDAGMKVDNVAWGSASPDRPYNRQRGNGIDAALMLDLERGTLRNVEVSVLSEAEQ